MRIETGTVTANTEMPNWDLDRGRGIRTCLCREEFEEPFEKVPSLSVGLAGIDLIASHGRVALNADVVAVDTDGFEVNFVAHDDQNIKSARVSWMALGD